MGFDGDRSFERQRELRCGGNGGFANLRDGGC